ncbi:hypothetical protein B296_00059173 [Ensete ventricosum]|uniref:Uncharacterized protein n=1 Tax=Ensete ventricosum TaxID=4639 RepID=A0A426X8F8_ENSVE|nr:hypothetical protein B296_00059173 [Ensete ventricosum]
MVRILFVSQSESDLGVAVTFWSSFHRGLRESFAHRGAIAPRNRFANGDIDLFLDGSLRVGRRIPGGSTFRRCSLVSDIPTKMSMRNEVFNLVFEVVALICIMSMLSVETIVFSFVVPFRACFDWVRGCEEPFLFDLKEKFCPGRVEGNRW